MSNFTRSIRKVFLNAGKSFVNYPATMVNALLFTLILLVRTTMDWEVQKSYDFLLNSLQLTFAFGALFSLAATTFAHRRGHVKNQLLLANLLGLVVPAIAFFLLYLFGSMTPKQDLFGGPDKVLSILASARMVAAGFLSLLAFLLLAGEKEDELDFSGALFMAMKAFFLALIYGLVILGGVSGVFGAIRTLIYPGLDSKIFGYVASISFFIAFSIFVGYFPNFRKGVVDEHREVAETQPRFIAVLFEFILVPIMLALTVVLLLWAILTVMGGMNTRFINLYSIATSFAVGGLLLHILISKNDSGIATFYKKVFPFAALFILLFEAWALINQLNKFGLKTTEYLFILIWIMAFASSVLLILKQAKAHRWMVYLTSALVIVCVLPLIGFTDLPFVQQINRLESILTKENMISEGQIVPAKTLPSLETREFISESVDYLINADGAKYPNWLVPERLDYNNFKETMGFERVYPGQEPNEPGLNERTSLNMMPYVFDVSDYQWAITPMNFEKEIIGALNFTGKAGEYEILWNQQTSNSIPTLEVKLNGESVLKGDLKTYLDATLVKYPLGTTMELPGGSRDMLYQMESDQVMVTLMFNNININAFNAKPEPGVNNLEYYLSLNAMFLNEK